MVERLFPLQIEHCNLGTVLGRHLGLASPKPAISLSGDLALAPAVGRQSLCAPLEEVITQAVQAGLSAQRIYQDLVAGHDFGGGYHSVQRFVRQLLASQPVPFVRLEVEPGQEAQVDFGLGAWVVVAGKRKRPHLFRIVLSHSRKAYSEVVWRQTTESFIRCLENAFRFFGGVPGTLIVDYVARHIIHVLCPARICALKRGKALYSGALAPPQGT